MTNSSNRRKVFSVKLRVSRTIPSVCWVSGRNTAERGHGGPATQENEYVVAHGESHDVA